MEQTVKMFLNRLSEQLAVKPFVRTQNWAPEQAVRTVAC